MLNIFKNSKKLTNMYAAYRDCTNLTGNPVCGPNVTDMSKAYQYCSNLTGSPVCGPNVINMCYTYYCCYNLTGSPVCGDNVTNMNSTYYRCINLTGSPVCGNNVTNMYYAYSNCKNLTGQPVCGPNVTNMEGAYTYCNNITGSPAIGSNVLSANYAYFYCSNLTGSPVCGPNVISLFQTYYSCSNLTGSPVCGPNVVNMYQAYDNCINLTGAPACGPNVEDMYLCYTHCPNLCGNAYFRSNKIKRAGKCFYGRNTSNRLDLYMYDFGANSTYNTINTFLYNASMTFENKLAEYGYYYSPSDNIYIQPVSYSNTHMNIAKSEEKASIQFVISYNSNFHIMINNNSYNILNDAYHNIRQINGYGHRISYMPKENKTISGRVFFNNFNRADYLYIEKLEPLKLTTDASNCYANVFSLVRTVPCPDNITNMARMYYSCTNYKGTPQFSKNATDIDSTYAYCRNLTGSPICPNNVTSMSQTYLNCYNLTGQPVCGPNVTNMYGTYDGCYSLTGSPICPDRITVLSGTYANCSNLTGSPVCGPNVEGFWSAYRNCSNLTGSPVCTDKVKAMTFTYYNCFNLTGQPVCGNNVGNFAYAYKNCYNLNGFGIIGPNVTCADNAYANCSNLQSNAYVFSNMIISNGMNNCFLKDDSKRMNVFIPDIGFNSTYNTIAACRMTTNSIVGGTIAVWTNGANNSFYNATRNIYIYPVNNVVQKYKENELSIVAYTTTDINMRPRTITGLTNGYTAEINGNQVMLLKNNPSDVVTYVNFYNTNTLTNVKFMTDSINDMNNTYYNCYNLTGQPMCGNNVTNMRNAYANCYNLTGSPVCGPNVTSMRYTYYNCRNLTGNPVCGDKVTSMYGTYYNCQNLTGSPVCGPDVTDMDSAYVNCYNLTGSPVCGPNVTDMFQTYYQCYNLTGSPACGPNVTSMSATYKNCRNLTGIAITGPSAYFIPDTYANCLNIHSNAYIFANHVNSAGNCFGGRNSSTKRLNIYLPKVGHNATSNTLNTFLLNTYHTTGTTYNPSYTWNGIFDITSYKWVKDNVNNCYVCNEANAYIYPVANVEQAYKENELLVATYITSNSNMTPVFNSDYAYTKELTDLNNGTFKVVITANTAGQYPSSISFSNQADLLSVQKLKTDNLITLDYMFAGCTNLTEVDSSSWNLNKVTSAKDVFYKCNNLK